MPTPRRGRSFGGSSAHERLMMANLAASLFAAEAITTTEAKAKALRPLAEKLITKAKKAQDGPMRVHRIRQIQGYLGDREMTHKLVNDVAPRVPRAQRRLHPDPEDRHALPATTPRWRASNWCGRCLMRPPKRLTAPACRAGSSPLPREVRNVTLCVMSTRRARFLVAYDGTDFHGFAPNVGVRTVLGELSAAVSLVVRTPVELTGAGRTDAGVHAWGQVVSGDLPDDTDLAGLARRINKMHGPEIAVRDAAWASPDFDARFSANYRHYRYHVWNDPAPNPLEARTSWHVPQPLALWAMRAAGDPLIGEHDFASFCRRPKVAEGEPVPSLVRRVLDLEWTQLDDTPMLRFDIRATSFCHQMVRSIVGTMVDVGLGHRSAGEMAAILRAGDRNVAGQVAPPTGLVLWTVGYEDT